MSDPNSMCFVCGPDNPIGLKLEFWEEEDRYYTTFTPRPEHQGYNNMVHGGITSAVLDEIMTRYLYAKGLNAVTARLEVRYRQPVSVGAKLTAVGWITGQRRKMYQLAGELRNQDGSVAAEATATAWVVE